MMRTLGFAGIAATGLVGLLLSGQANAAALAPGATVTGGSATAVESVAYRRCWWEYGVRRCARVYGYGPRRAEDYRTGSGRWWRQMDREGRGGRGTFNQ